MPGVELPIEHYTSRTYAHDVQTRGRALIGDGRRARGIERIELGCHGVMYTAPNGFTAAQLDARVPLSLGTWHRHIDFCWAPPGLKGDPRFGFAGSIHTQDACAAAGGNFTPLVCDPARIWAVDAGGGTMHMH